jgi:hypothetical protein
LVIVAVGLGVNVAVAVAVAVGTGVKVLVWVGGTGVRVAVGVAAGEKTPQAESAAEANKHKLIILGENNFIMARSSSFLFQTIQPRL